MKIPHWLGVTLRGFIFVAAFGIITFAFFKIQKLEIKVKELTVAQKAIKQEIIIEVTNELKELYIPTDSLNVQ